MRLVLPATGRPVANAAPKVFGTIALILCALSAAPAYAQSDQEKARELYSEGIDLYFAEDYGVAITKFNAGYQLDPNAMFLYSLSLCFSKLGNFPDALEHAERAKETGGMPTDVATKNDARLVSFSLLVRTEETAEFLLAERQKEPEVPTCATNAECSEGEVCNMRRGVCVAELPPQPKKTGKPLFGPLGWAGVGASAVGIGLLVGGGVTSLSVAKNEERFELVSDPDNAEFDADERDELLETLESQKSTGRILVLGGAGLTAVGIGLIIVDLVTKPSDDDKEAARLAPMLLPGGGGITLHFQY